jgi:hypothetical protein
LLVYAGKQEQQGRWQQQTCPQQQMYARNRLYDLVTAERRGDDVRSGWDASKVDTHNSSRNTGLPRQHQS